MARRSGEGARSAAEGPTALHVTPDPDGPAEDCLVGGVPLASLLLASDEVAGPRSKRATILNEAAARFGESGYESTKWSAVASEVGIGQTALYHYFESKAHCLLTIMRIELARSHDRFVRGAAAGGTPEEVLRRALQNAFAVSATEVMQLRIVMANTDVLAKQRASAREEEERQHCLALTHAIESSWTELVTQVLGGTPEPGDAQLRAQAVLGLINSVWRWYRPGGRLTLEQIAAFYVEAGERVVTTTTTTAAAPERRRARGTRSA